MGLLSSSKSRKTTQNITDIDTTNVVASEGSIAAEGSATVNVLDAGAIQSAFQYGSESFSEALGFAERVVTSFQEATDRQVGQSIEAIATLAEGRQQGESALWTRLAGWAIVGAVAIAALVRFTK